jgi:hypothetical protein
MSCDLVRVADDVAATMSQTLDLAALVWPKCAWAIKSTHTVMYSTCGPGCVKGAHRKAAENARCQAGPQ